eukprot:scaffold4429_cov81-Skeletonema_dohrnii-CCMP3373.AAC.2
MHEEWQESFAQTYCSPFTPALEQYDNTIGQPNWLRLQLTPASSIGFGLLCACMRSLSSHTKRGKIGYASLIDVETRSTWWHIQLSIHCHHFCLALLENWSDYPIGRFTALVNCDLASPVWGRRGRLGAGWFGRRAGRIRFFPEHSNPEHLTRSSYYVLAYTAAHTLDKSIS